MTDPAPQLPPAVSALEARLGYPEGTLDAEDLARATAALEDATTLVLAEVGDLKATAWTAAPPAVVVLVILKAARREFDNPRGLNQEALGEHSVGISETSGVYLSAREIDQIKRAATKRRGGFVGTVYVPPATGDPRTQALPIVYEEAGW